MYLMDGKGGHSSKSTGLSLSRNQAVLAPSSLDCMAAHAAAPRFAIPAVPSVHGYGVLLIRWFNAQRTRVCRSCF